VQSPEAVTDATLRGRDAYERHAWADAFAALSSAGALDVDDTERLAWAAVFSGRDEESFAAFERLHQLRLGAGEPLRAASAALWLAFRLLANGEHARASGWFARAQRLVDEAGADCVQAGYLLLPAMSRASSAGDDAAAQRAAAEMVSIGVRHADEDLCAMGRIFGGRALIRQGRLEEGLSLLDEAMVAVTGNELTPLITGFLYCTAIAVCQRVYALDRAREWTASLGRWCDAQPQLVAFAGVCQVHRSEILQLGGAWPEAFAEARRASERLASTSNAEAGSAFYQEGELLRLRGEHEQAERLYVQASERGRDPQPGRALLRLAEGRVDHAVGAIRRVLSATSDQQHRLRILPAYVEIMIAASNLDEARKAADELSAAASTAGMEMLSAIAEHAIGAVILAEGDAPSAIGPLRRAEELWQKLGAPYLSARIRVLLGRAFSALGDEDSAELERGGARKVFLELGAAPDLATIVAIASAPVGAAPAPTNLHGLSRRETDVLLLLAAGKTNKVIATELFLSERTVDRHVSNIFAKLGVATRSAATAWAYQKRLIG